jgi:predicted phosphodiesterase
MAERLVEHKEWDFAIKNNEGEIETQRLTSDRFEPEVDNGDFIRQAKPTIVRQSRRKKPIRGDTVTLAFGDAQIPFQDERAMSLALRAVQELQPDNVVLTGDMLDLPSLSRFEQRREWAGRMQEALDRYHLFLAQIRARHVGRLAVVHGNHEERLPKMLRRDAAELIGLRRANSDELGILTIQYLARYDDLDVESITGYPNGTLWLEDNLQVTHGTETKRQGMSAVNYLRKEQVSTIFGHDHRLQVAWQTRNTRLGGVACVAASPGCLARTDGYTPGYNFTTSESGLVVPHSEDWQNGVLMILHNERNHDVTPLRISEQGIHIGDKYYGDEN